MPTDDQTRWTVTVSQQTDIALRTFLAQRGLKKGALSVFIEEAVQWRLRELTRDETRQEAEWPPEALALGDEVSVAVQNEADEEIHHH